MRINRKRDRHKILRLRQTDRQRYRFKQKNRQAKSEKWIDRHVHKLKVYIQTGEQREREADRLIEIRDKQKCGNKWRKRLLREIVIIKKRDGLVRLTKGDKGDVERRREGDNNLEIET